MSVPNDIVVSITTAEANLCVNNSCKAEPVCQKSSSASYVGSFSVNCGDLAGGISDFI